MWQAAQQQRNHYLYQLYLNIVRPKWCEGGGGGIDNLSSVEPVNRVARIIITAASLLRWFYLIREFVFPNMNFPFMQRRPGPALPHTGEELREGDIDIVLSFR